MRVASVDSSREEEGCGTCTQKEVRHFFESCWWFPLLGMKATILPRIWSQILISLLLSYIAYYLHHSERMTPLDTGAHELVGIVLGFLLGFRVEACAQRFQEGETAVSEMLSALVGFGVLTCKELQGEGSHMNLDLIVTRKDVGIEEDEYGVYFDSLPPQEKISWAIRKEFLRLTTLALGLACRDLQKGALMPGERFTEVGRHTEEFYSLCKMTGAEKIALKACDAVIGSAPEFRTELVLSWISKCLGMPWLRDSGAGGARCHVGEAGFF